MKYIAGGKDRYGYNWDHGPYWAYLESVKDVMPAHVFAFAFNRENHDLESPNSLHDAWLTSLTIEEVRLESGDRSLQIALKLLGSKWDRHIHLVYKGVADYRLETPNDMAGPNGHGDLLVHELVQTEAGLFSHELVFATDAVFFIRFADLEHRIQLMGRP